MCIAVNYSHIIIMLLSNYQHVSYLSTFKLCSFVFKLTVVECEWLSVSVGFWICRSQVLIPAVPLF